MGVSLDTYRAANETEFHFFFECNRFAAERRGLSFAAAEQLLGIFMIKLNYD
jgi:hypothetical protein